MGYADGGQEVGLPGREVQQRRFVGERVRIPQHVVFRAFVEETVVLNLETGLYHGLNAIGGRMIEVLAVDGDVTAAARQIAEETGAPEERVATDLDAFCADLLERGLIRVEGDG